MFGGCEGWCFRIGLTTNLNIHFDHETNKEGNSKKTHHWPKMYRNKNDL